MKHCCLLRAANIQRWPGYNGNWPDIQGYVTNGNLFIKEKLFTTTSGRESELKSLLLRGPVIKMADWKVGMLGASQWMGFRKTNLSAEARRHNSLSLFDRKGGHSFLLKIKFKGRQACFFLGVPDCTCVASAHTREESCPLH